MTTNLPPPPCRLENGNWSGSMRCTFVAEPIDATLLCCHCCSYDDGRTMTCITGGCRGGEVGAMGRSHNVQVFLFKHGSRALRSTISVAVKAKRARGSTEDEEDDEEESLKEAAGGKDESLQAHLCSSQKMALMVRSHLLTNITNASSPLRERSHWTLVQRMRAGNGTLYFCSSPVCTLSWAARGPQ